CETVFLQWPFTVDRYRIRILSPKNLYLHQEGSTEKAIVREVGGLREYLWDLTTVPALVPDSQLPNSLSPYARVMVTEFESWSDIAKWSARVFASETNFPAELETLIAQWKTESP